MQRDKEQHEDRMKRLLKRGQSVQFIDGKIMPKQKTRRGDEEKKQAEYVAVADDDWDRSESEKNQRKGADFEDGVRRRSLQLKRDDYDEEELRRLRKRSERGRSLRRAWE
jgi:hypothetical protein